VTVSSGYAAAAVGMNPLTAVPERRIVPAKGDIPTALAIFQTTSLAVTVIGALLSALPLVAVAALLLFGYRAARNASLEGYALAAAAILVCFFVTPWPVLAPA
jgi:hypothetical protein